MEIFASSIRLDQWLRKLSSSKGEERFRILLGIADEARKMYEGCLEEAVDMDLSTEHNIEASNVARAGRCYNPLRGRVARERLGRTEDG